MGNVTRAYVATLAIVKEFKVVVSIVLLGAAIALGLFDVPVFRAIVDGLADLATAGIQGIGL